MTLCRPSRASAGSALLEVLVIGFAIVLLVSQGVLAAGRLQAAGEQAAEAAEFAAEWAARYGDPDGAARHAHDLAPGALVDVRLAGDRVVAVVALAVPLIGPEGSPVTRTVTGRAAVALSRYRSVP